MLDSGRDAVLANFVGERVQGGVGLSDGHHRVPVAGAGHGRHGGLTGEGLEGGVVAEGVRGGIDTREFSVVGVGCCGMRFHLEFLS